MTQMKIIIPEALDVLTAAFDAGKLEEDEMRYGARKNSVDAQETRLTLRKACIAFYEAQIKGTHQ